MEFQETKALKAALDDNFDIVDAVLRELHPAELHELAWACRRIDSLIYFELERREAQKETGGAG